MHLLNVFVQEVVFGNILWIYGARNYQLSSQCPSEDHLHNVNKVLFGFEASNKFGVVRGAEKDRKIMTLCDCQEFPVTLECVKIEFSLTSTFSYKK